MQKFLQLFFLLVLGLSSQSVNAQLSGTVTVPGTYPTLSAAITALNTSGVSAATTIEVTGDQNAPTGGFVINTFTGASVANLVTIKAIGIVNLIPAVGTSTTTDGVVKFNGADFVTIEGFTITENPLNTTATQQMEWGIAVLSQSATNSSQNITIKNCNVNLNGTAANTAEIGIYAAHHSATATTALTPTSAAGTYANLKIIGCTVDNAYTGISIGISGSATNLDANVTVGEMGAGNTITNFGGGATQSYGVRLEFATNANINYNTVDNTLITTQTTTLDGIYNANGANQSLTVTNNVVKVSRGAATTQMCAIRNIGYTGAVTWNNNEITGCIAGGSSGVIYYMYNTAAAASLTANNNNIHDNLLNTTGGTSLFYNTGAVNNLTFNNNLMTNNNKGASTTGTLYAYWNTCTPTGGTETINGNTVSGLGMTGFTGVTYGLYSSTAVAQNRVANDNKVSGLISSGTTYCIYLLSGNQNTINNNKVFNITNTGTGIVYGVYNSGNSVNRSGNKVSDISFTGSGGTFYGIYGASTVQNNMNNDTVMNMTGNLVTAYAIYVLGSSTGAQIHSNYVDNLNGVNTFGGLYLTGTNITAYNNTVKNITGSSSSTTGTIYGIYCTNTSSVYNLYSNTFENFTNNATTTGSMHGLFSTTSLATLNAYKNKFINFSNTSGTTCRLNCINLGGGTNVNVYNNLFSDFNGLVSTDGAALNAIHETSTAVGTHNFYNNTFRLNGTLNNGGATAIFFNAATSTINCQNNIFDIDVTATDLTKSVAMIRKATAAGAFNYATTSNNNLFYLPNNTNAFYYIEGLTTTTPFSGGISPNATPITGTTDAAFNTPCSTTKLLLGGRESATFDEQVTFVNDVPTGTTHAESGGQTIALVTDDINGTTRTSPPDIGAYEFSGTAIVSDVVGPAITYTNLPNSICTNSVPFTATITDASGINTASGTKPRVWFKKSSEPNVLPPLNTSIDAGWKYVEATNSTSPFAFNLDFSILNTPVVAGEVIQYFVAAQDLAGNVNLNQVVLKNSFCAASVALDTAGFPTATNGRTFNIISPPSIVNTVSNKPSICSTGEVLLSLSGDPSTGAEYQWQSSSTFMGTYTDIPGATNSTYTATVTNASNKNFQCVVKCSGTPIITSAPIAINYFDPQVLSVANGTRCGAGTVDLSATVSTNATANWFNTPTGGNAIATGSTFTTPTISATTNYYVEATEGGSTQNVGLPAMVGTTANTGVNIGIRFDAIQDLVVETIDVYPSGTGAGTATFELRTSSGTVLQSYTTNLIGTATPFTKVELPVNFNVPAGLDYRIVWSAKTGLLTGLGREATSGFTFPYTLPGVISLTNSTTTGFYYYIYNWKVRTGCRSARQAVTATITTPPTVTMPANITMCSNEPAQALTVSSSNAGYSYEWGPAAGLNTTSGATVQVLPSTTTAYQVTATDNSGGTFNGCSTLGNVTVTVNEIPTLSETKSSKDTVCFSDNITFSLLNTGTASGLTYQWQSSANGATYNDISGATNSTYNAFIDNSTDKFYQCKIFCKGNLVLTSTPKEVIVNAPSILTTTGATRCGTGAVTLSATASTSANIRWYEAATGGTSIATGATFTTPAVTATRDYYVAASLGGGTTTGGMLNGNTTGTSGAGTTNYGIVFDVLAPFTLKSVKIYPISATGLSGTVTIDVINSSGTIMHTKTFNVTGSPIGSLVPTTVDLDFALVPGTNYKIRPGSFTGITGLQFEPSASAPGGNYGYPMVVPGLLNIVTSTLTAAPTNTARNDLYYYFYEWVITNGCESPRQAVTVTVNPADAITASPDVTICSNGTGTSLSVTSVNQNYTYAWGPSTGLASTTGTSVVANPSTTTSYFVTATDASLGCENIDTVNVIVNQVPTSIDVKATLDTICVSNNTTLSLFNAQPNAPSGLDYQWQSSMTGTGYTDIVGANSATYTAAVSTSTERYFRCNLTCLNNPGVISNPKEIIVSDPQVASVSPATRCGAGTVTLSATPNSVNETIKWYNDATGGLPIGTGNTFTTPIITSTRDFYVESSLGGSSVIGGRITNTPLGAAAQLTNYGLYFVITEPIILNSVDVFSGTGTAITVALYNSTGSTQLFTTGSVTTTPGVKNTINLGWTLAPGAYRLHEIAMTGTFYRESGTGVVYPTPLGTAGNITGYVTSLTSNPVTSTTVYYYFYNWNVSTGCASARQAVTATITPSPNYSITTDKTVCNNGVLPLTVTAGLGDYNNFTWSPQTNLYTDAAGTIPYTGGNAATVYFKSATAGNQVILSSASNTVSQCSNVDDITITNLPVPTLSSIYQELCISGSSTLSLSTANYGTATFEWLESANGTAYSTISGATNNNYLTPTISTSTYYKVKVFDDASNLCAEPIYFLNVNNPSVATTTGGSACPSSTVTLGATASGAGTIKWYDVATGGTSLATGNTYTTPVLGASKTYYVESIEGGGGVQSLGLANRVGSTTNSGYSDIGLMFNALQAFTLQSVAVYPVATTPSGNVTFTVQLKNSAGTVLQSAQFSLPTAVSPGVKQTIQLNFPVPAGTGHRLVFASATGGGITGFIREVTTGFTYPYTLPGVASITSAYTSGASSTYYYYFYDWQVTTSCASARVPVVATINSCPRVNAKVFLNHVNPTTGLMDDYLKTIANFPLSDPYAQTGAFNGGFTHVNSGTTAATTPTVLATLGNNAIVDWVFLELRQGTSGATSVVATKVGLLQKDGDVVGMDGVSPVQFTAPAGSYYLTVRHRNHIGFRTDATLALSSTPTSLNFTNNSVVLYGSFPLNPKSATVNAMNGGDANSDGSIDAFDTITWEVENGLFDDYFLNSDYNLDGSVDAFDSIEWELNNGKYQELD